MTQALERATAGGAPSAEHEAVVASLVDFGLGGTGGSRGERLELMRQRFDDAGTLHPVNAEIVAVDAGGVAAEWVLAPGADPDR